MTQEQVITKILQNCKEVGKVIKSIRFHWSKSGELTGFTASYKFLDEFKKQSTQSKN